MHKASNTAVNAERQPDYHLDKEDFWKVIFSIGRQKRKKKGIEGQLFMAVLLVYIRSIFGIFFDVLNIL